MAGRAKCESLQFQAEWGAKNQGVEVSDAVRQRIAEEIIVLGNMGLVEGEEMAVKLAGACEDVAAQAEAGGELVGGAAGALLW